MNAVTFFETITISPPEKKIYARLGYRKGQTCLSPSQRNEIECHIDQALSLIQLKGAARRLAIKTGKPGQIILEDKTIFMSHKLLGFLKDSSEILLLAATAGRDIMKAIVDSSEGSNMTAGIVYDAVASEMTDASLQWIMDYTNRNLRRSNKQLTQKRYSAGYGDFELQNQKTIFRLLELEKLDMKLTKSYILIPEKSVTAVAGILDY